MKGTETMSSKGRGSTVEPNEFYQTPEWCVHRLLDSIHFDLFPPRHRRPRQLIEHAVGNGAIIRAFESWRQANRPRMKQPDWFGYDVNLRPGKLPPTAIIRREDFTKYRFTRRCDLAITNPPFSLALDMAKAALKVAPVVIQLSRIGWLGSNERADWLRENTPSVYLLPDRPSFVGKGRTDSDYYAWIVWGLDDEPRFEVLGSTPLAVRKAEYEALA